MSKIKNYIESKNKNNNNNKAIDLKSELQSKTIKFLSFNDALIYVRAIKLENTIEWEDWVKTGARPANIPSKPHEVYKHDGWQGWGHWLGTGNVGVKKNQKFLPFKNALVYARSLKLQTQKEWQVWRKTGARPANMPSNPHVIYKDEGWQGYGHWLGTGNIAPQYKQFLPFKKALVYARSLKLKSLKEWQALSKSGARPVNIPGCPDQTYTHDGWQGYGHWLGTYKKKSNEILIISMRSQETRQERKNKIFKKNKVVLKAKRQSKKIL